ncbi:MAG: extracellular solute-binding protein [Clostridia bacterium]|nr:extracellular solute-binding protein [Clostridia bacterium]
MKRLISILLLLTMLLCACTAADPASFAVDDTHQTAEQTADETDIVERTEEDSVSVSSLRYIREYETVQLGTTGGYLGSGVFLYDQKICSFGVESNNGHLRPMLTMYDETGASEIVYPPEPTEFLETAEDGSVKNNYTPKYAYPMSDGQYLLLYANRIDTYLCIVNRDCTTVKSAPLPDTVNTIHNLRVDADGDRLHILINSTSALYYFDESLTLQHTFKDFEWSPSFGMPLYLGDGVYLSGMYGTNLRYINVNDGSMEATKLRLPRSYSADSVYFGGNDEIYIGDDVGIMRYEEDRQPETVLKWSECGYYFAGNDIGMVLNDNAVLLIREAEYLGRRAPVLHLIRVNSRPITAEDKSVITLLSYKYIMPWLSSAIYRFNQTNQQYHVNLVSRDIYYNDGLLEDVDQILMSGSADMIIPMNESDISGHYEKNIFVDLTAYFGDRVLGCIGNLYGSNGTMYALPTAFSFTALTARESLLGGADMTWDTVYKIRDALSEDTLFAASELERAGNFSIASDGTMKSTASYVNLPKRLYQHVLSDYTDSAAGETRFDTEEFRDMIEFLQWMTEHADETAGGISTYATGIKVANQSFIDRLRSGGVAITEAAISRIEHLSLLQRLYGDAAYVLCGYPSEDGGFIRVKEAQNPIAVLQTSEHKDGCIAFLEFLLSDEMQNTEDDGHLLPVTESALRAQLEEKRWFYYLKSQLNKIENPNQDLIDINFPGTHHEYVTDYGITGDTESMYDVFSMTDETIDAIIDFFNTVDIRAKADETILEIVNEELSYWQNNARSLEETTKIIDSRVWIYLNE